MLTMNKEKEIMRFAKSKVKALRILLESQEVQEKYPELSGNNVEVEWEKFRLNIDNFTFKHYETQAELLTLPLKCVGNLNSFKLVIEEICRDNNLGLYVVYALPEDEYGDVLDEDEINEDCCLRLCSPSMNRNLQTLRLMTYIEEEKINSLIAKVNHGDKSLQKNVGNLKQLLRLGVEVMVNISYSMDEVVGIIRTIADNEMELIIKCKPEILTLSTIKLNDPWEVIGIQCETPINHMWNYGENKKVS